MNRIAIILLAAGGSTRLGSPKQLIDIGGVPLVRHVADRLRQLAPARFLVVTGAHDAVVRAALPGVECQTNPDWHAGLGTSIVAGVRALQGDDFAGVLIALCDQPNIPLDHYRALLARFHQGDVDAVATGYASLSGVPAVFAPRLFPALAALKGDRGAKAVLSDPAHRVAAVACPDAAVDLDTPDDLERFRSTR